MSLSDEELITLAKSRYGLNRATYSAHTTKVGLRKGAKTTEHMPPQNNQLMSLGDDLNDKINKPKAKDILGRSSRADGG
jgi:hypothetical protein